MTELGNHTASYSFLTGGGEMGQRIDSYDWSQSALGRISDWPQSLCTTLGLLLHARFPMILFWGPDRICFYNDAYHRHLSNDGAYSTPLGMPGNIGWPELEAFINPLLDRGYATGESVWSEDQLVPIYRNGQLEEVYWTFSCSPVYDQLAKPAGMWLTCLETTGKVATLQQAQAARDQLIFAVDAADLGTWSLNPATNHFTANARLKSWFGLAPADDLSIDLVLGAIADVDRQRVVDAIERALQSSSGGYYDIAYTITDTKTGQERIVRAKGQAYFDDDGTAQRFVGTTQDITEQLTAREQIRQAEQMTQLAVAGAGAGTFFVDLTDNRLIYSPTLAFIFTGSGQTGLTRESLLGYIVPEDLPIREKAYQIAAKTGKLNYEARTVWLDGSVHWVRVFGAYLFGPKGATTSFSGIALDITAQQLAQQELERQVLERTKELSLINQALLRTNHELEQFAYIASHDLQEPLRKIQSFADLLQENQFNSELFGVYLSKIIKSAQRMSSLIKAVLEYSRLAAKNDLFEEIDLNQIVETVLLDFDLLVEQKGAVVRYDHLPTLTGIPLQLGQLFSNLIGNALKFTNKDPLIQVSSRPLLPDEYNQQRGINRALPYVRITVQDNGIGFDPQYADRIFALFQRLSNGKAYGGTGIGLALCRKIVENHGGFIHAESVYNQGAAFHVYLPLTQLPEAAISRS